jgi:hypothetical protein
MRLHESLTLIFPIANRVSNIGYSHLNSKEISITMRQPVHETGTERLQMRLCSKK